jgi:Tol biopolymer transport system component
MSRSIRKVIARLLPVLPFIALGISGAGGCGAAAPIDKIVFDSKGALDGTDAANANETSNIWIMSGDGTERVPLTSLTANGTDSTGPLWSPDGTRIAFSSSRALDGSDAANLNEATNVWVMDADGKNAKPLTGLTALDSFTFAGKWSPDGKKILFTSSRALDGSDASLPNGVSNLWIMDADGSDQRPLTELTADYVFNAVASWSPDGSEILFASTAALDGSDALNGPGISNFGVGNLWIMNADGSDRHPLTNLTVGEFSTHFFSSWTPDGSKIAFHSNRALDGSDAITDNFAENLWVMNADGTNPKPLTNYITAGSINGPSFSPDGTKIAFNSTYD